MTTLRAADIRELREVLGPGVDQDAALETGAVRRFKVQRRWLYVAPELSLEDLLEVVLEAGQAYLEEWLLSPAPLFRRGVHGLVAGDGIGLGAIDPLIKELAADGRLSGLALLNASYQPYVAFHRRSDDGEIGRQIDSLERLLHRTGRAGHGDLPLIKRPMSRRSWQEVILKHGEWRGWGRLVNGELLAWP